MAELLNVPVHHTEYRWGGTHFFSFCWLFLCQCWHFGRGRLTKTDKTKISVYTVFDFVILLPEFTKMVNGIVAYAVIISSKYSTARKPNMSPSARKSSR